ncbi:heparan-alpha-glucosaminide N-acetyltransferase domain-containing protein [Planosporangium sp. 12N6]|uniref:heparan-alpha-glucosaminide N-acetyltransferase domain-containing protein n=1 Tax=Planosporangium spinosum TaxID=3402278 RepID=UPI003CEF3958
MTPTTHSPPAGAAPVKRRLVGVDAVRGVALLGMMAVHSLYDTTANGRPSWSFWLFGGRAAATFAVLAGVGVAFMTGRRRVRFADGRGTVAALVTRALAIGAIGLALGATDASIAAVILPYYAVMFVLVIPLVFLPTRTLAVTGALLATGVPALTHTLLPHLPVPDELNPGVADLAHPAGLLSELAITGEYPALPWMTYLCAGLIVGRLTLTRLRVAIGLLGTGVVLAVGATVASSILLHRFGGLAHIWAAQPRSVLTVPETTELLTLGGDGTTPTSTWWWLATNAPHTSTPLDLVGTTGTALALLGFMLLASHVPVPALRRLVTAVQAPLAAAGSMTLTFYCVHIVFINSEYDYYEATTGFLVQVVAVLLLGLGWRATMGRGPLEAFVTALARRARRWATSPQPRPSRRPLPAARQPTAGETTVAYASLWDLLSPGDGARGGDPATGAPVARPGRARGIRVYRTMRKGPRGRHARLRHARPERSVNGNRRRE